MEWIKVGVAGLVSSFLIIVLFLLYSNFIGVAPFYVPESTIAHQLNFIVVTEMETIIYTYGIAWSLIFVLLLGNKVSISKGIGLGVVLWLFMMVVYGPFLGWGFFGFHFQAVPSDLSGLVVASPWAYTLLTLALHLVFGFFIGLINKKWVDFDKLAMPKSIHTE